jgi:hypothetical protein
MRYAACPHEAATPLPLGTSIPYSLRTLAGALESYRGTQWNAVWKRQNAHSPLSMEGRVTLSGTLREMASGTLSNTSHGMVSENCSW